MDGLLQHGDVVTHLLDLAAAGPVRHIADVLDKRKVKIKFKKKSSETYILSLLMKETRESHHRGPLIQTSREILPSVIEPRSHSSE